MDVSKVKRMIGQCTEQKELNEVIASARKRKEDLENAAWRARCAAAWERVKDLAAGTVLYCCAEGIFIGGHLQRGDSVTVHSVQPRAKRLWVKLADGSFYWFAPAGVSRYDLRLEPPVRAISQEDRAMARTVAKAISELPTVK